MIDEIRIRNGVDLDLEEMADELLRTQAREIDPATGKERGIGGKDPILFKNHIQERWRREILNDIGIPDPAYTLNSNGQPGMFFRIEPQGGRKVNTNEQRLRNGASYYRHHIPFPDEGLSFGEIWRNRHEETI